MDRLLRSTQASIATKNHPADTINSADNWVITIDNSEYVKDYILQLTFNDGKVADVDFEPFLRQSLNPLIQKYLDIKIFKEFTLEHGDLHWNDYDLCFPIADLYDGGI